MSMLEPAILDAGLGLAMEWGQQWLMPIQSRLVLLYPDLDDLALELYNEACQSAMRFGHALAHEAIGRGSSDEEIYKIWLREYREAFPWATEDNLRHLYSQGRYYAWRDGA